MDSNFPRVNKLPPYVFDEIQTLKAAARKRGEDIIDFGMGNPDQPTPEEIVEKLRESALKGSLRPNATTLGCLIKSPESFLSNKSPLVFC